MRHSRLRFAAYGFAACGLAGCALFGGSAPPPSAPPPVAEHSTTDLAPITPLLELMSELPKGDPARQAELFQSAKDAAVGLAHHEQPAPVCARAGDSGA